MRLDSINPLVMVLLCVLCAAGLLIIWVPRLPAQLRTRMYLACIAPIPLFSALAALRGWSFQVTAAYYVCAVGSIAIGSLGRGREITEIGRGYVGRSPGEPEPQASRAFVTQILVSLAVLFAAVLFSFEDM
ncbi:hypothetical protein ACFW2Y_35690 [Streptomyces sp. NPDC058877]|uniref:hypothetical protein n=1 Tax=unclassified Streptomyces TaxID=2593676 RepID=UPI0036B22021